MTHKQWHNTESNVPVLKPVDDYIHRVELSGCTDRFFKTEEEKWTVEERESD